MATRPLLNGTIANIEDRRNDTSVTQKAPVKGNLVCLNPIFPFIVLYLKNILKLMSYPPLLQLTFLVNYNGLQSVD